MVREEEIIKTLGDNTFISYMKKYKNNKWVWGSLNIHLSHLITPWIPKWPKE